jgi:hypothetical protein
VFSLMLIAGGPAPVATSSPVAVPTVILVVSAEAAGAVESIDATVPADQAAAPKARRHRRGHANTALPYFSFAQGLRQVAGS